MVGSMPPGKDVALDEVGLGAVAGIEPLVDGDGLHGGPAAGLQPVVQHAEIGRPVRLAHCLDHLDRGDGIEALLGVAIVLEADFRPAFRRSRA